MRLTSVGLTGDVRGCKSGWPFFVFRFSFSLNGTIRFSFSLNKTIRFPLVKPEFY